MKLQIINFEVAKLAKEKGFDWKGGYKYSPNKRYNLDFIIEKFDTHSLHCDRDHGMYAIQLWNWNQDDNVYSAPTVSLLCKWLRKKHNIIVYFIPSLTPNGIYFTYQIHGKSIPFKESNWTKTPEEALEKGLFEELKNLT